MLECLGPSSCSGAAQIGPPYRVTVAGLGLKKHFDSSVGELPVLRFRKGRKAGGGLCCMLTGIISWQVACIESNRRQAENNVRRLEAQLMASAGLAFQVEGFVVCC